MRKLLGCKASSGCLQYVLLTWKPSLWYVAPLHDPQTFEFCRNQCLLIVTPNVRGKNVWFPAAPPPAPSRRSLIFQPQSPSFSTKTFLVFNPSPSRLRLFPPQTWHRHPHLPTSSFRTSLFPSLRKGASNKDWCPARQPCPPPRNLILSSRWLELGEKEAVFPQGGVVSQSGLQRLTEK